MNRLADEGHHSQCRALSICTAYVHAHEHQQACLLNIDRGVVLLTHARHPRADTNSPHLGTPAFCIRPVTTCGAHQTNSQSDDRESPPQDCGNKSVLILDLRHLSLDLRHSNLTLWKKTMLRQDKRSCCVRPPS
jgi:hypothetical protein